MINEIKNGDLPAMPVEAQILYEASTCKDNGWEKGSMGLTKREQFAMAAMQGIVSNPESIKAVQRLCGSDDKRASVLISSLSVSQADALLAELDK